MDYGESSIPRIGALVTFYGCAIVMQFDLMNVFNICTSDTITRSRDKLRRLQSLTKAGIGIPEIGLYQLLKRC